MKDFVFLFRFTPPTVSRTDRQAHLRQWLAWVEDLAAKGHLKEHGLPLDPFAGKVVGKDAVTDGPCVEKKQIVGGYLVIAARDIRQAVKLAAGCPIVAGGGRVEVRPVGKM